MPAGVAIVDPAGRRAANPGLCALLDAPAEQLRGMAAVALAAEPPIGQAAELAAAGAARRRARLPGRGRAAAARRRHHRLVRAGRLGDHAATTAALWLLACTDVSEQRRAAELLRSAGTVDELTRLPNRAACLELLRRLLARPGRDRVAVICGDLDDFQRVNSALGHEAGDDLLVTLAGRLQRELPVGCTAARLAADEFVVVCGDHAEAGGPEAARRDRRRPAAHHAHRARQARSSSRRRSAWPCRRPAATSRAADLLRFAEVAMHDAKRVQPRRRRAGDRRGRRLRHPRLELEAELRAAIAATRWCWSTSRWSGPDGLVCTAEALVRWPHPERGVIPPGEFLPVAQRGGLLRELDDWVLRTARRRGRRLAGARRPPASPWRSTSPGCCRAMPEFRGRP